MPRRSRYRKTADASSSSFLRQRGKAPGSAILVVTEGKNTEPIYFEELRNRLAAPTVELETCGEGAGDPKVLVDAALRIQAERQRKARRNELGINQLPKFDELWIVFDIDVLKRDKLSNGIAYAKSKRVHIAPSNPCFEFWLLLHEAKAYTTSPMSTCTNVIPFLKSAFDWQSYSKSKAETSKQLPPLVTKDRIQRAVQSAVRVRKHHDDCGTSFPANPATEIDLLIQAINGAVGPANKFL